MYPDVGVKVIVAVYVVTDAKVEGDPNQVTIPVYPVPAVVVVTGVAPVTGVVTPAIAAVEMTMSAGTEGGEDNGGGVGRGVAVVIVIGDGEAGEGPATLFAVRVNV